MKRWKNHIASSLLLIAFLISIYGWHRSSHWFEKWAITNGIGATTILSKDSRFEIVGRTYPAPSAKFEWKFRKDLKLRNRRGSMKLKVGPPIFTSDSSFSVISGSPTKLRTFKLDATYWHLSLLLLILTATAFWTERKISQRRLEN